MTLKLWQPDRDFSKAHTLIRGRWPVLKRELEERHGILLFINEVYRPEARQQWLYGAGRGREKLIVRGINPEWARPTEPIVTNAWSARTSSHGWVENGLPASCAIDVVPVGADQRPWTKDDDWDRFVALTDDIADVGGRIGLIHFHAPGKAVWDKPHLQLKEWSDEEHRLVLPAA